MMPPDRWSLGKMTPKTRERISDSIRRMRKAPAKRGRKAKKGEDLHGEAAVS